VRLGQVEHRLQGDDTPLSGISLYLLVQLGAARKWPVLSLRDNALELVKVERRREVEDRSRRAGEVEAVAVADVARVEGGTMNLDPGALGAPRGRHCDGYRRCGQVGDQLPDRGCASVAEYRARSAGQERGHLARERQSRGVADHVDAPIELVETASAKPPSDLGAGHSTREQLAA
jgi:hypothetical protein